jgi:hypothetical protein
MSLKCKEMTATVGCLTMADGTQVPVQIHYEYSTPRVPNGQPCVVVLTKTTYTDAAGVPIDPAALAGGVVAPGACPVLVANPVHWCDGGKCVEGKAWYRGGSGLLDKVTDLNGVVVVPASPIQEGGCEDIVTDRAVCVKMNSGEHWNVIERIVTNMCGSVLSLVYLDPDTSPMKDITADVGGFLNAGDCDCCA